LFDVIPQAGSKVILANTIAAEIFTF
jgi:hypothetical protein